MKKAVADQPSDLSLSLLSKSELLEAGVSKAATELSNTSTVVAETYTGVQRIEQNISSSLGDHRSQIALLADTTQQGLSRQERDIQEMVSCEFTFWQDISTNATGRKICSKN